jgi:hypothetical protein
MLEDAHFAIYTVPVCGYCKRGEDVPEFGTLASMLEDILDWSEGKSLAETRIDKPRATDNRLPALLLDAQSSGSRYLLSLWNEVPSTDGRVASVQIDSGVGEPAVVMNEIQEGTIPGFATYFYFIPDRDLVIATRFQHKTYGNAAMRAYIRAYLRFCGRYTRYDEIGEDPTKLLGYAEPDSDEPKKYRPSFATEPYEKPGEHKKLINEAHRITKIVRKTSLDLSKAENTAFWQKLLQYAHLRPPRKPNSLVRVNYNVEVSVKPDEVRSIIRDWDNENPEEDWEDVGFMLSGEQTPYWLSHANARTSLKLDITRDSLEVVNGRSLIKQMMAHESQILRVLA